MLGIEFNRSTANIKHKAGRAWAIGLDLPHGGGMWWVNTSFRHKNMWGWNPKAVSVTPSIFQFPGILSGAKWCPMNSNHVARHTSDVVRVCGLCQTNLQNSGFGTSETRPLKTLPKNQTSTSFGNRNNNVNKPHPQISRYFSESSDITTNPPESSAPRDLTAPLPGGRDSCRRRRCAAFAWPVDAGSPGIGLKLDAGKKFAKKFYSSDREEAKERSNQILWIMVSQRQSV